MKRYLILLITVFALFLTSCEEEETAGISKETQFPVLTMNGDRYISVAKGGTFTDPGVTAKEGDNDLTVNVKGEVNTNTVGVYNLTYSAINSDGFPASLPRTVVVAQVSPDAAANDLSGNYARNINGSIAKWTKIGPGVYTVFNPGGAPGTNVTIVVINSRGFQIDFPEQIASDGGVFSGSDESYNPATKTFSWKVINPGYGTALRTFVKQ